MAFLLLSIKKEMKVEKNMLLKIRMPIILISLLTVSSWPLFAQANTVGILLNEPSAFSGYTLFSPSSSTMTYLIDNEGRLIHSWSSAYKPGQAVYLLDNGDLLRTANPQSGNANRLNAGGAGGRVEKYDWQGHLLWAFEYNNDQHRLHHDVKHLTNGNVLMIAWEYKTAEQAIAAGRKPTLLSENALWPDHILEVQPDGTSSGTVVWEWHVWDHLIQDYDAAKANYGNVSQHPELIDVNYSALANQQKGSADWNHTNSIAYNPVLDQIILSIHNLCEIWIIDHSTTTAEAAGHSGGRYGKGGDLLYRWGNPQAYRAGGTGEQQFFGQHDAQWIDEGFPGSGHILVFNNGLRRTAGSYSTVDEFIPPLDNNGIYPALPLGSAYAPAAACWCYKAENPTDFYSSNISGAQRLANGNTLICEGSSGHFFEVTAAGQVVWSYINPVTANGILTQGADIQPGGQKIENSVFKIRRYSQDFSGFIGRDLTPGDPIELSRQSVPDAGYPIVDTGQSACYNNSSQITAPLSGTAFYGQDAQYTGQQPVYRDQGDGTVSDLVTGLMWQKNPREKMTYDQALAGADTCKIGGYTDWRLPSIKELYSLILFNGKDPSNWRGSDTGELTPFIDTNFFVFQYGDESIGERIIDAQFASSTRYVSMTMGSNETIFGVNFADGRIKGYPCGKLPNGSYKKYFVLYVRGNTGYGINEFVDHQNGALSDQATGLMWQQRDSEKSMNWQEALAWVHSKNKEKFLGYDDWRLPNAKELHSLVDYTRSPATTQSAAINPLFFCSTILDEGGKSNYPFYWTSTTHADMTGGTAAVYFAFGEALGWMETPPNSGNYTLMDVHGAGAQRSDPKAGDPADYPHGFGPQGDVRRIYNYVRLVRDDDGDRQTGVAPWQTCEQPGSFVLSQNYPNPFNPETAITFSLSTVDRVRLQIFDLLGRTIATLVDGVLEAGMHKVTWNAADHPAGIYYYSLSGTGQCQTKSMVLLR